MIKETRIVDILDQIEREIDKGSIARARILFNTLGFRRVPRNLLLRMADLSRQARLHERTVRILHPVVRPAKEGLVPATPEEKMQYALALGYSGSVLESARIFREVLSEVRETQTPQIKLFLGAVLCRRWDFESAVGPLDDAIASGKLMGQQKLDGELYLASALMHGPGQIAKAEVLLENVIKQTHLENSPLAHKEALQLAIQAQFLKRDWEKAKQYAERAQRVAKTADDPHFTLYVDYRTALADVLKPSTRKEALVDLERFKQQFMQAGIWDGLRGCDYWPAMFLKDEAKLIHLYFGTVSECTKARIAKALGGKENLPEVYEWRLGALGKSGKPKLTFDVTTGKNNLSREELVPGQVKQRLIEALCSDFYVPPRVPTIFEYMYPDEPFDPQTSPPRIHMAFQWLRGWLEAHKIPLEAKEDHGRFWLDSPAGAVLRIERDQMPPQPRSAAERVISKKVRSYVEDLRGRFGEQAFTVSEGAQLLDVSERSVLRYLNEALKFGRIKREGAGPSTQYRIG